MGCPGQAQTIPRINQPSQRCREPRRTAAARWRSPPTHHAAAGRTRCRASPRESRRTAARRNSATTQTCARGQRPLAGHHARPARMVSPGCARAIVRRMRLAPTSFTRKPALQTVGGGRSSIRSMTGIKTPSSACTRRPDEFSTDENTSARWPEQVRLAMGMYRPIGLGSGPGPSEHPVQLNHYGFIITPIDDQIGPIDSVSKTECYDVKNLRQPVLEGLMNLARMETPQRGGRNKSGEGAAAAALGGGRRQREGEEKRGRPRAMCGG
ncbi:zinc finger family protein [Dorcoceras hygrometricum]|uniref:Zinc finger family protein n=1 Tax=Dorcoceras hygrometricum TaxID=472368 RepID=A0A2Z7BXE1_9LAMI|nr:zinc finger family protein [Dorcoceras hygrometricum]